MVIRWRAGLSLPAGGETQLRTGRGVRRGMAPRDGSAEGDADDQGARGPKWEAGTLYTVRTGGHPRPLSGDRREVLDHGDKPAS